MSLLKSGTIVASFTLISRIFGYIRDILLASFLGTGMLADAFTVAFKLPNFFRTLFAEGALSAAFVPMFTGKFSKEGKESAKEFANLVFTILLIALILFISILEIFMPFVMYGLAPGFFDTPEKFNLVTYLSYLTTPYLLFISLASLLSGILNSVGRFAAAAALPIILNITMICTVLFLNDRFETTAHTLAFSVFIAGLLQFIVISFVAYKADILPKLVKPKMTNDVKKLFRNMLPVIIGSGVVQINLWIGTIIASQIDGAVALLYYAERLNQFPLAIIGTAIGTVLLPTMSRLVKEKNFEKVNHTQNRAFEISLLLTLPCAFAYFAMGDSIITILFERNEFNTEDSINVARALAALACGLPAFVLIKILTPRYFAAYDTKTPVKISMVSIIFNIILSIILINYFAHVGIAIAAAISAWINVLLLYIILHKRNEFRLEQTVKSRLSRIIVSCSIMGASLYILQYKFFYLISNGGFKGLLVLLSMILIGGIIYISTIILTKAVNIKELTLLFARKNG